MDLYFIDTETTHLHPKKGEIIEFALIVDSTKKNKTQRVAYKIKPEHIETAHRRALEVNGYTEEKWEEARSMDSAIHDMYFALRGSRIIYIGHNISFDLRHINHLFRSRGYDSIGAYSICTKALALEHLPYLKSYSLDALRSFFSMSKEGAHTALKDAHDCREIYYRLIRASTAKRLFWRVNWMVRRWKNRFTVDG